MKTLKPKIRLAAVLSAAALMILSFSCQSGSPDSEADNGIVGRWDYVKTVNPDGTEEFGIIGMEHYYADGTILYLNMWLDPFAMDSLPGSRKEILDALVVTDGGFGSYEFVPENQWLRITLDVCTDTGYIGLPFELKCEIIGDTIVFRDKYFFVKARE